MSQQQNPAHNAEFYGSGSGEDSATHQELPAFESFPQARDRDRSGPYSRSQAAPYNQGVAQGSSQRYQAADDLNTLDESHRRSSTQDPSQGQRQRTTTLPAFTPFPAAAPGSKYAPPEGSRAAQVRPIPPPAFVPESSTSGYLPLPPPDAIRYPSGLPPGQPSPYAPPGPLTARPHVCEHCDSGFARAHDLKRHLETHKSERPHKCPNCQRSFSRKDAVQRHIIVTQCTGPSSSK